MNKVTVEYETSNGLKTEEFQSDKGLIGYIEDGVLYIEEKTEILSNNQIAIFNLKSLVSYKIEKIKED